MPFKTLEVPENFRDVKQYIEKISEMMYFEASDPCRKSLGFVKFVDVKADFKKALFKNKRNRRKQ